ncbi:hypothetical protein AB833_02760 [Chromatiales bacterium (ex Bugula neritina AB1)]|nr:hypothetical protein AB833_02760 [Chromatiales bacterium (ex Bugula neritina AB1)]
MTDLPIDVEGGCLCGKVTYRASLKPGAGACHCGMCRKWSGGPLMSVHAIGKVSFTGNEYIKHYASSQWAQRGFCKHCGSNLYYHLLARPGLPDGEYILAAGSVNDQSVLKFDHEVYVDHAPGWYRFADEASRKRMTEADIMALYGPDA